MSQIKILFSYCPNTYPFHQWILHYQFPLPCLLALPNFTIIHLEVFVSSLSPSPFSANSEFAPNFFRNLQNLPSEVPVPSLLNPPGNFRKRIAEKNRITSFVLFVRSLLDLVLMLMLILFLPKTPIRFVFLIFLNSRSYIFGGWVGIVILICFEVGLY